LTSAIDNNRRNRKKIIDYYEIASNGEDICLHCFHLIFKSKRQTKEFFVSPTNSSLAGILITIDDVTDIFAIVEID